MSTNYGDPKTRERLVETAWRQLSEKGAAVKLSEIAEEAGVSRQAVYLHFGDRTGMLLAVVRHMDHTLQLDESLARVLAAASGVDLLERAMRLNTTFWADVYPVARVLQASDEAALIAAWRDRMQFRQMAFRAMIEKVDNFGELDEDWTIEDASIVLYGVAHFDTWRELTQHIGWSDDRYVSTMTQVLSRSLLTKP